MSISNGSEASYTAGKMYEQRHYVQRILAIDPPMTGDILTLNTLWFSYLNIWDRKNSNFISQHSLCPVFIHSADHSQDIILKIQDRDWCCMKKNLIKNVLTKYFSSLRKHWTERIKLRQWFYWKGHAQEQKHWVLSTAFSLENYLASLILFCSCGILTSDDRIQKCQSMTQTARQIKHSITVVTLYMAFILSCLITVVHQEAWLKT